jgi:hypothetical protein
LDSLIKRAGQTAFGIRLRNFLGIKPVFFNDVPSGNGQGMSVSDSFVWRTDNDYKVTIKYPNSLKLLYGIDKATIQIDIYTKDNIFIKRATHDELSFVDEFTIDKEQLNGLEDFGLFYLRIKASHSQLQGVVIVNRCYVGYSRNDELPSFVHDNSFAKSSELNGSHESTDIVKTSFWKKENYRIQESFLGSDKSELFFSNPTSKTIRFSIGGGEYRLESGHVILIDVGDSEVVAIKSNCYFFRPLVFRLKGRFLDVHHA